jgi:hypothetical protein
LAPVGNLVDSLDRLKEVLIEGCMLFDVPP